MASHAPCPPPLPPPPQPPGPPREEREGFPRWRGRRAARWLHQRLLQVLKRARESEEESLVSALARGPHFCLGYHVAMLEGAIVLLGAAQILSEAGLALAPAGPLPAPNYAPLVHPPRTSSVALVAA